MCGVLKCIIERLKFHLGIAAAQRKFNECIRDSWVLGQQRTMTVSRNDVAIAQAFGAVLAIVAMPLQHRTKRDRSLSQLRATCMVLESDDHGRSLDGIGPERDVANEAHIAASVYMGSAPIYVDVQPS